MVNNGQINSIFAKTPNFCKKETTANPSPPPNSIDIAIRL